MFEGGASKGGMQLLFLHIVRPLMLHRQEVELENKKRKFRETRTVFISNTEINDFRKIIFDKNKKKKRKVSVEKISV